MSIPVNLKVTNRYYYQAVMSASLAISFRVNYEN